MKKHDLGFLRNGKEFVNIKALRKGKGVVIIKYSMN